MFRRTALDAARGRALAVLAVSALALTGCAGDGADEAEDPSTSAEQTTQTAEEDGASVTGDEQGEDAAASPEDAAESSDGEEASDAADASDASDAADGDAAAAEGAEGEEACVVDAATVSSVFAPVFGAEVEYLDSRTDERGGVSCSFETTGGELFVNFGVSASTWDGSQEEVDELVATLSEFAGDPTARPDDLGDHAVLFNEDGGDLYSLAVFSGDTVYSFGMTGDLEGSADQRREVLVGLYQAAAG